VAGMKRYVRVDCETEDHVIELGLDGSASARDSVHQALFAQHLTGKQPVVLLIDRDGYEGRFEHEMRHVGKAAGVLYLRCSEGAILRWAATSGLRRGVAGTDDLPGPGAVASRCDLQALRREKGAES